MDAGGGRRWRPPNVSSLSRARTKLGPDVVRLLFEEVTGPVGAPEAAGVWCCGLRMVSMDGSTTDIADTPANRTVFSGPSNDKRDGAFPQVRWVVAAESGTGALIEASIGPYTRGEQTQALDLLAAFTAEMLVMADRKFLSSHPGPGHPRHRRAHPVAGLDLVRATPGRGAHRWHLPGPAVPGPHSDGPPITVRVIEYTVHTTPTAR